MLFKLHSRKYRMLNASQFAFRARHSTTLQCMRLTDHVTSNFKNSMSTASVFLGIEKPSIQYGTLAVVKLTTVPVNRLPLLHKIRKIGMICSVKPVLTEDLSVVQKEKIFNNMLYV
jgi:hypothetical protein